MVERVLVTGASGRIGTLLRPLIARPGRMLRLLDTAPPTGLDPAAEEAAAGSVTDMAAMERACKGVDLVVHLAGHPSERPWAEILDTNIHGCYTTLEAARRQGVRRVLLASSNHAVGFVPAAAAADTDVLVPRPDTYYGVSKAAMEALGSVYADRFAMSVVSARIGTFAAAADIADIRTLATWFSPGDAARLVEASLALEEPGHRLVWGISRNTRRWFSLAEGEAMGFHPRDDAEDHAAQVPGAGEPGGAPGPGIRIGGTFTADTSPLGGRW
ncbi:NAD-dependent epimerase/dehydratase family protein [Murinocardiopsis flavida]|uniref:NAD-dependent epimerase/dehydratase family protein n=1 Tax=Murinocardiopsis flavida TaxID=645275 RepID=UPI001B808E62|nr:NAD(P)-dependent oxidoreductase [Murinocardiopsis flavida]